MFREKEREIERKRKKGSVKMMVIMMIKDDYDGEYDNNDWLNK
jgi:hypothetical protein